MWNSTYVINDLGQLKDFAKRLAKELNGGEIIGLVGDLGAGKTTLVQALAEAMGVEGQVKSPTFILMQCFKIGQGYQTAKGINELCHVDAYRLENEDELFAIGFGEYAEREDAVSIVEWADRIESLSWLEDYREIKFDFGDDGQRILDCRGSFSR
jgi:tRNA threonylcarbamoyladenosine biosynthesis protein TsaE